MDGRGYPLGLRGEEILLPTRLMTVADIYDALTAQDRPYKPALPASRALALLEEEARTGAVDPDVLTLFVEAEVYRGAVPE
jgi:HD-GYP domain-containing protein (c-di-GMP phosphodiesterase class II)